MDVDVELDPELMNKLNTMGTRDHEDLVSQFQTIVGTQISPGGCAFYLEMANWNLQNALCAYYDIMNSNERLPSVQFIEDVTVQEGETIPPNTRFTKTWRIRNNGAEKWPSGLRLKLTKGRNLSQTEILPVTQLNPGESVDISIPMVSPSELGIYESQWRLINSDGNYIGDTLNVAVTVEEDGVFSLTQQMSGLGRPVNGEVPSFQTSENTLGTHSSARPISTPNRNPTAPTPFCSPTGYGIFGGSPMNPSLRESLLPTLPTINESLTHHLNEMSVFSQGQPSNDITFNTGYQSCDRMDFSSRES